MSVQNTAQSRPGAAPKNLSLGRVFKYGLLSIAAAVIANLLTFFVLAALLDLPAEFPPFSALPIIFFTVVGTFLGVLVLAALTRLVKNPIRTYTFVAAAALVLSILPNLGLMQNPANAPFPGGRPVDFAILILFHVVAAVAHIAVVHRLRLGE